MISRFWRRVALIYLFVDRFGHEVVAYIHLNTFNTIQFVNVVPDILCYLETKNGWTEGSCKMQIYIHTTLFDIHFVYQL